MKITVRDKTGLQDAAIQFLDYTRGKRIFGFYGAMGAGKTTIIKSICRELGTVDIVTSPTFTLVNEYKTLSEGSIYHIDLYRIKKPEEVFDFGIEEYFSSGSYCFIEWPELAEALLPDETVRVNITVEDNELRVIALE